MRLSSSQVVFWVSHTSVVSVPRTARAFSRAALRQDTMLDGLASSLTMKSSTARALTAHGRGVEARPIVDRGLDLAERMGAAGVERHLHAVAREAKVVAFNAQVAAHRAGAHGPEFGVVAARMGVITEEMEKLLQQARGR